jgi:predicted TIM-barrel fold metal-dependent hydrolase
VKSCPHIYCRASVAPDADACARCGHPMDPARLRDPSFLMEAVGGLSGLPGAIVDMHQILPTHPMALPAQLMLMDALGIGRALLQSVPAEATSLRGNEALASARTDHPDRFISSWYIDPREPDALAALDQAQAAGARVIKLLPVVGYRLDDPALLPFWARIGELGLVVLVHTGFITARHKAEEAAAGRFFNAGFGDPLQLDEPARRFPGVPIILAHSGGALFYEAGAQLLTQHDNIWGDVSGFGLFALQRWLSLGVTLDWSKVFWGNDAPFFHYPANLRLLQSALAAGDAVELAPALLHDNGAAFCDRFLA